MNEMYFKPKYSRISALNKRCAMVSWCLRIRISLPDCGDSCPRTTNEVPGESGLTASFPTTLPRRLQKSRRVTSRILWHDSRVESNQ